MTEIAENVRAFLSQINLCVIATSNRDGSPHQTALWYLLDGDEILLNTATASKGAQRACSAVGFGVRLRTRSAAPRDSFWAS